ncbi:MAG: GAF domain-containing protein [Firmicutes bacterium]|nr:GAF domain-containing protein [Bacillota bacterium]
MFNNKAKLIENLTGVNSSKLNYYVELKKRNEEIVKQNNRLEIIHQLIRDINIDMSTEDIIGRVYSRLPMALPCDFLGLVLMKKGELRITAMMPQNYCLVNPIPRDSSLWRCFERGEATIFDPVRKDDLFIRDNPVLAGQLRSLVVAPLFVRAAVRGLLLVGSKNDGVYSDTELTFVNHLADQLAISIQNARLYKQVSRAKREWEETFKAVTEPILLIDTCYNILRCNDRLPPEMDALKQERGNKCYRVLWGLDEPCADCLMDEVLKTRQPVYRRVQMDSGRVLDINYYPVFNDEKQISAVIHHMKDITEKTKMEAQLVQSAKLAAIGEMAAGVAHELNNPMTVIIGTAQLLLRDAEAGQLDAESLKDIVNCGLRCKKIIQNLLTFSRQDQYPFSPTDLNAEIENVLSLIQYQVNKNKINIVLNLHPSLPSVTANGHQLQQVLINFLLNARDALEGVERDKVIEVASSVREDGGKKWVVVSVRDNGTGIAPENLPKIFNPFYTSKEAARGTGLGLSVSLGIAEAHGGTIEVESTAGAGSVFSLVLPVDGDRNGDEQPSGSGCDI